MKIIFINHYVWPGDCRTAFLAQQWIKSGHEVSIVCASNANAFFNSPQVSGIYSVQEIKGIRYIVLKTSKYNGNGISRFINILTFIFNLWKMQKWFSNNLKPDVVIAGSAHTLDCLPAVRLARRNKALFVREVRDLWPLTLRDIGGYSERHPVLLLFRKAENYSYRNADLIITTLPNSFEYMRKHGLEDGKWTYIPQGVDLTSNETGLLPDMHTKLLDRLNGNGMFILGYAGSIGIANCLDTLIESAKVLEDNKLAVVIMGSGFEKENLQARAGRLGLKNIYFLPPVPRNCVPEFLSKVSAAFISWKNKPLYQYGISPNKLMAYMLAGKPVIHAVQASNDLVADTGCGISIPPENPAAVAGAIKKMMSMSLQDLREMGKKGRDYVKNNRDYAVLAAQFLSIIQESRNKSKLSTEPS